MQHHHLLTSMQPQPITIHAALRLCGRRHFQLVPQHHSLLLFSAQHVVQHFQLLPTLHHLLIQGPLSEVTLGKNIDGPSASSVSISGGKEGWEGPASLRALPDLLLQGHLLEVTLRGNTDGPSASCTGVTGGKEGWGNKVALGSS